MQYGVPIQLYTDITHRREERQLNTVLMINRSIIYSIEKSTSVLFKIFWIITIHYALLLLSELLLSNLFTIPSRNCSWYSFLPVIGTYCRFSWKLFSWTILGVSYWALKKSAPNKATLISLRKPRQDKHCKTLFPGLCCFLRRSDFYWFSQCS